MSQSRDEQEAQRMNKLRFQLNRVSIPTITGMLVVCVGTSTSLVGCKGQPKRESSSTQEPVNTGLRAMSNDDGLALPSDDELLTKDDEFGSVTEQLEESARQLNVYFANMEIDGVDPVPEQSSTPNVESSNTYATTDIDNQFDTQISDPISQNDQTRIVNSNQPNPKLNDTGSSQTKDTGVRVSLLDGGGVNSGSSSDDSALDEVNDPAHSSSQTMSDVVESEPDLGSQDESTSEQVDPNVRKQELAHELASILSQLASTSDTPGAAALALTSLETLLPDGENTTFDEGVLSEAEKTSIDAVRRLLQSINAEGAILSPGELASGLEEIQTQLNAWAGLTIKKAALCTWVEGYGRYETFSSYRFIAGQAQDVIVYVELERFAQLESSGPDGQPRYQTKLSQRLELYHAADDLNAWNRRAETVTDETRNRLRDYYLTNMVTLPANLGVGRYHLKIVTRDLIGERIAETIIPIEIVSR